MSRSSTKNKSNFGIWPAVYCVHIVHLYFFIFICCCFFLIWLCWSCPVLFYFPVVTDICTASMFIIQPSQTVRGEKNFKVLRCADALVFKTINEDHLYVGKFALKHRTQDPMVGEINQKCGEKWFLVMVSCLGHVHAVYVVTADYCLIPAVGLCIITVTCCH